MSAELPFVSVVTPIYNRRNWVMDLLATLAAQNYPRDRYEVIVVDNGSTDGSWEAATEFARTSETEIRCFRNPSDVRVPAVSRNLGIEKARGEIVCFTDSDCLADADWIRNGVKAFRTGVGVVEGRVIPVPTDPAPPLCRIKDLDGSRSLFDTSNIFYRREALRQVDGFAEDFFQNGYPRYYGEDLDLGYRVKQAGWKRAFAADALIMHHNQPQNLWQWMKETRLVFICPYIAKKHPSTRKELLFLRYFLSPSTALFDLALVGVALTFAVNPWWALLSLPFVVWKTREVGLGGSLLMRPVRIAGGCFRAVLIFGVLAAASLRYRSLIL